MSRKDWSLSGRIVRWLVVTTVGLVVLGTVLGGRFVHGAVEREIRALLDEEVEEMSVWTSLAPRVTASGAAEFAAKLQRDHPSNPMAWRVERGEELLGEFGAVHLRPHFGPDPGEGEPVRVASRRTEDGYELWLVLDASAQLAHIDRFHRAATAFLFLVGAVTLTSGLFLRRLVVGHLDSIVGQLQARDSIVEGSLRMDGLPREVRSVGEALDRLLGRIRAETERNELLTAGTAHELRSPIQNLLGETELSLMRERSVDEYRAVLRSHREELRRLVRAVDNLVTLCSTRQRRDGYPLERFDLAGEAELRLGPEHERAAARDVELAVHARGDVRFEGDREALVLVVRNLVGNAVDWAPKGSRVEVRIEGDEGALTLVVDDEGPGVPPEERDRIFEPFYRGATAAGVRAGYGLGLALTRSAVEAHGGWIGVESAPSGGARFSVTLPRRPGGGGSDAGGGLAPVRDGAKAITGP